MSRVLTDMSVELIYRMHDARAIVRQILCNLQVPWDQYPADDLLPMLNAIKHRTDPEAAQLAEPTAATEEIKQSIAESQTDDRTAPQIDPHLAIANWFAGQAIVYNPRALYFSRCAPDIRTAHKIDITNEQFEDVATKFEYVFAHGQMACKRQTDTASLRIARVKPSSPSVLFASLYPANDAVQTVFLFAYEGECDSAQISDYSCDDLYELITHPMRPRVARAMFDDVLLSAGYKVLAMYGDRWVLNHWILDL